MEKELQNNEWGRAALEITLAFDQAHHASIAKSEQESPSVVDYFLLLPKDYFEGPPSIWLRSMRESGGTIDRKNGFMYCAGDGAQPEFEVALFRYADGRPLLAMSNGELEGADNPISALLHAPDQMARCTLSTIGSFRSPTAATILRAARQRPIGNSFCHEPAGQS